MQQKKSLHIFGVTGSIGQSAADVVLANPGRFAVHSVTAHRNVEGLVESAKRLSAKRAVIADEALYEPLKSALAGSGIDCAAGPKALIEAASTPADLSLMAIVGVAGLWPLWEALEHSKAVAIANKEPLVAAGKLVIERAAQFGTALLPVDSEHNAIFQVLNANAPVRRIVLTASGGPFLDWPLENIAKATLEEALKHPNWVMGPKITIDSASMMNKGLEVIEAHYLFGLPPEKIEVLIHPQSLVHGMVEYEDGSVLCQMGASDMRTPIAHILGWPERITSPGRMLDWETLSTLTFRKPDLEKFPALGLAYRALEKGPGACLALNAANEVMVEEFLQERCGFLDIVEKTSTLIDVYDTASPQSLDDVEEMDRDVRARLKCDILNYNQKLAGKL